MIQINHIMIRLVASVLIIMVTSVHCAVENDESQLLEPWMICLVVVVSSLVLIAVLALCGGCTPMEVGSDDHAASGGRKSNVTYSGVCTDPNMRVLSSGTSLPNDPYQPGSDSALPYPLHPPTQHNFAGYESQSNNQGQTGGQGQPGYQTQHSYQATGASSHRHFSETEPPPPAYHEAIQATAPQQPTQNQYGW
ncbi:hypothetical protein ACF0H5_011553 [Mactra antiquata]